MPGPATLKRLVLHLNTQTISIPEVTVVRDRGVVILKSTITNLGLAAVHNTVIVCPVDRWGRFETPIGIVVNEDSNPKTLKLPYFIQRLLGVLSLEDYETRSL